VRRNSSPNYWLWHTLNIGNVFGPTFGFKIHSNFNPRNKVIKKNAVLMIPIFPHGKKIAPPYTSPYLAQTPLSV
jgi:hypothetical protein